jgi:hypothetical protein
VGDAFNPKNFRLCYEVGEIKKNIIKKYLDWRELFDIVINLDYRINFKIF